MAIGNITGYEGALRAAVEYLEVDGDLFIKVYNDTGAAVNDGDVYMLSFLKDADSSDGRNVPTLDAAATTAIYRQFVVVQNFPRKLSTIADADWGFVQVRGYCRKVKAAATVVAEDFLQGTNATAEAADDGTSYTTDSFGIAKTAVSGGFVEAELFGTRSLIG